ncbi:hypothetical protein ACFX13_022862 [Malus domestica]
MGVLMEVDLRLPLKRVMIINDQEDYPVLLSYEKLFEVCFYYGRRRVEGHKCQALEDKDGWLLVDRVFEDEPLVMPSGAEISEETRQGLHGGVMLVFPQPTLGEEAPSKDEEELELRDQVRAREEIASEGWTLRAVSEILGGSCTSAHCAPLNAPSGWTTVASRKYRSASRGRSRVRRDGRSSDKVVRGNRTWVSKADLVSKWRPDCALVDDEIVGGNRFGESSNGKGKATVEEEDEFMEAEEENLELLQIGGSRKRVRNSGDGNGSGFVVKDVDW